MSCELIAEVGWSHLGDMEIAGSMIDAAAKSGANYVKFQTWSEKKLKPGPWDSDGRREIYKKAELSKDEHIFLKNLCESNGVKFLTSCFCPDDLDFIRELSNVVKIPSTECNNSDIVISAIDKFDKVFISTGAMNEDDYKSLAKIDKVYLLHCVSSYPCPSDRVNLPKMQFLSYLTPRFGYSGHAEGIFDAIGAIALNAKVVEKHFTIDKNLPGRDNKFAILPYELKQIRQFIDTWPQMLIDRGNNYQDIEKDAREQYARRWISN